MGGWLEGVFNPDFVPPLPEKSDAFWMALALKSAAKNLGVPTPNPTVGCVLVKDGQMISKGATEALGGRHAEIVALTTCSEPSLISGSTAYVTLEPCSHFGRTPPCTDALIKAGIKRCVIGTTDPFKDVNGGGIKALKSAGIQVDIGIMEKECFTWHQPFLHKHSQGEPLVAAKWAQTIDGCLADDTGGSQWITGPKARSYTHWLRQYYDTIMVGIGTVLADQPSLTVRDCLTINRHPVRIIFDPKAALRSATSDQLKALSAKILSESPTTFWATAGDHSIASLPHIQHIMLQEPTDPYKCLKDITTAYEASFGFSLNSIMIEGGPRLLGHFLAKQAVHRCHIFINPSLMMGSQNHIQSRDHKGEPIRLMCPNKTPLTPICLHHLDEDIVWETII